jgi:hypothetical protein
MENAPEKNLPDPENMFFSDFIIGLSANLPKIMKAKQLSLNAASS